MPKRTKTPDRPAQSEGQHESAFQKDSIEARRSSSEVTSRLASYAHDLRYADIGPEVQDQALQVIRDTLGTMLAGSLLPEIKGLADLAKQLSAPGRATIMGSPKTVSPHYAALVNGSGAVSLELDEGNQYAVNHPSVHILPAALALAEEEGSTGADLLTAFIAGYEIAVRVGRAVHLREAVHPFGTHAAIGTAAAAGRLLGLDRDQLAQALHLAAGTCIASSQTAANTGASVRNLITGLTNHNGLLAPMFVRAGFTGEPGALNRVFGLILGESFMEEGLGKDLGREFYITRNYFKLHACSRWNHAPIEATAALMARSPFDPRDVEKVTVWTYDPATRLSWDDPPNGYAGKHSIPYNIAVRLVRGANGLDAYSEEAVTDPDIRETAKKVVIREDPRFTEMLPHIRPARVEVILKNGNVLTEEVHRARGGFDNPFTEDELAGKFRRLAGTALSEPAVAALEESVNALPQLDSLSLISSLLQGVRPV